MRTFGCSIVVILLFIGSLNAQNSPDCRGAIPVCADVPIEGTAHGGGIDDFDPDVVTQTGCLGKGSIGSLNIENNTSWYVFRAKTDGQLGFDIEAILVPGSSDITAEWDFAVYGPDVDCLAIGAGNVEPIRCNFEANDTGFTGVGVNPMNGQAGAPFVKQSQNTYDEWLDVKAGEVYYILINNWSTNSDDEPESFELVFTGRSVDADPENALDCDFLDEFLGRDIVACEGNPDIVLSALNSREGSNIANVVWRVDYGDDGIDIVTLPGTGPRLMVSSPGKVYGPDLRRYFVEILDSSGNVIDKDDILITYFGDPSWDNIDDIFVRDLSDNNTVEIIMNHPDRNYEYAVNGGDFQDSPIFHNVPPGEHTVVINDKNGCGRSGPIPFTVIGYPKFFTPNGDDIHDYWQVFGTSTLVGVPIIYIFDRYGKLLAQFDGNSMGWDGTYNGKPMPSSDYWFRMDYSRDEGGTIIARSLRRHFTLKR
ncbi:MAG TPA: T9SS type B sorting domain-containing protein [Arenibacter sp.]|nr:T9SS type B sorting domain-containing protein [Arenibacter sp.]